MRTTLKRGHGRGAKRAGPTLPPDALSPVTLYTADAPPPRSRLRRVGRVLGWIALVLVMLAVGFAGGLYLWLHEAVGALNPHTRDVKQAVSRLHIARPKQPVIALVLGYDHRVGEGSAPSLSDSMMLIRLDPVTGTVSMLSMPRDLDTTIHCPASSHIPPYVDKINSAYSRCGSSGSLLTVEAMTGLKVNWLITVNFRGFKKVVNTLGGVWIDVDRRYFNNQTGPNGYAAINLQPGYQRLSGGAALDFVRFRHTDSDFYRVARQQLFVQAMKEQLKQSFDVSKALAIIQAGADNVEVGIGGNKQVDIGLVYKWGKFVYDLRGGHFFQPKIENLNPVPGRTDYTTDPANIEAAVQQFLHPSLKQVENADVVARGGTVKQPVPTPARTSIVVLNGNGVPGAAADASYRLAQRGYRTQTPPGGQTPNAPFTAFHTRVYYLPWSKAGKAAASSLAQVLAPADPKPIPHALMHLRGAAMLTVVVGSTYHDSLTPLAPQPVIKHQAPNVVSNRSASEALVRDAQRQVPFSLLVPTVLEATSSPDTTGGDQPVRVYRITDREKAVRLVYRRGDINEYWGVEETNWQDAPVLSEKSFTREIGGRSYAFYYHGTKLHMIVLHMGKTDYWVVNTLVDSLSNETMIAIAKGLQPLSSKGAA